MPDPRAAAVAAAIARINTYPLPHSYEGRHGGTPAATYREGTTEIFAINDGEDSVLIEIAEGFHRISK